MLIKFVCDYVHPGIASLGQQVIVLARFVQTLSPAAFSCFFFTSYCTIIIAMAH
jgi:hypothetical protein